MKARGLRRIASRVCGAARRRWVRAALSALCALCAAWLLAAGARVLAPPALHLAHTFPRTRPADLAHLLADISANTHPIPGAWTLEEESGNYSSWQYAVSYSCGAGARCAGRVRVRALELRAPRHGLADAHRVLVSRRHCEAPPLLSWPLLCEEIETESVVRGAGAGGGADGAQLQQWVRSRCGWAAALLRACADAPRLRARAHQQLHRARQLLHLPALTGPDAMLD